MARTTAVVEGRGREGVGLCFMRGDAGGSRGGPRRGSRQGWRAGTGRRGMERWGDGCSVAARNPHLVRGDLCQRLLAVVDQQVVAAFAPPRLQLWAGKGGAGQGGQEGLFSAGGARMEQRPALGVHAKPSRTTCVHATPHPHTPACAPPRSARSATAAARPSRSAPAPPADEARGRLQHHTREPDFS